MEDLFRILNELQESKHIKVLSTIIKVEGSSYRKEGAVMLHKEDGSQIGLLSGGCLESDLAERFEEVIKDRTSRTVVYDTRVEDDLSWGQGSGCNGSISVLLEPIDTELEKHLKRVQEYLNKGVTIHHVKKLSELDAVTDYIFITENQQFFGNWSGEFPDHLYRRFLERKNTTIVLEDSSERYFIQTIEPKPRLIIFGAGPDVRPLVSFAAKTGFYVIVVDWRPAFCNQSHFPDANELILDFPSSFLNEYQFISSDSVIVMTHNFQKDQEILKTLLQNKLQYLGVLGPRKRTYRLLESENIPDKIHSPVGLPIDADGPEEIAISILAEVIKTNRERTPHDCRNLPSSRS
ncbi:XdhC family protein [Alteribacter populi]|uniref:XdhC family protein n=1 Tax=Alteribacter populi TaxID=2011011 RepID=UPI000BBA539D|nr:XdhC family protein [Alteribacter populi]